MRHLKHRHSLGVTREHRAALLSNLAAALIRHGRIETTLTKARALRPFIEKIITKAKRAAVATEKKDAIHLRRTALRRVRDEDAITLLFNEKAAQFAQRAGGYTRIYKLAPRRVGDSAEMALIEFVGADDTGYKKQPRGKRGAGKKADKTETAAPAAEKAPAGTAPAEAPAAKTEDEKKA
jgi:large subunit ribosomal protein L17